MPFCGELAEPGGICDDDRPPERQRLEHRERMRFELAHQHDDVHSGEPCGQFLLGARRDRFDEHAVGDPEPVRQFAQLPSYGPLPAIQSVASGRLRRMCGNAARTRWCPLYCSSRHDGCDPPCIPPARGRVRLRRRGEFRAVGYQRKAGFGKPEKTSVVLDLEPGDGNETARSRQQRPQRKKLGGAEARADPRGVSSSVEGQDERDVRLERADHREWGDKRVVRLDVDDVPLAALDLGVDTRGGVEVSAVAERTDAPDVDAADPLVRREPLLEPSREDCHAAAALHQARRHALHMSFDASDMREEARRRHQHAHDRCADRAARARDEPARRGEVQLTRPPQDSSL